ncbi:hypothetical protein ES708_29737 [subsurface metagenome]
MSTFLKQFERVKRYLNKIEDQDRDSTAYDDDLWSFFQNCHHLKDWIKNDPDVADEVKGEKGTRIEEFVGSNRGLRICADLANRSKHSELTRSSRVDAKVTSRNTTIYVPTAGSDSVGTTTCEHTITLGDGSKRIALDVARKAVKAWESFLSENKLI